MRSWFASIPEVLRGRRALVGFDPEAGVVPPDEWRLKTGVFPIVDAAAARLMTEDELGEAYWLYAQNQSAALDTLILLRRLRSST